jgi:hypothetical protein
MEEDIYAVRTSNLIKLLQTANIAKELVELVNESMRYLPAELETRALATLMEWGKIKGNEPEPAAGPTN